MTCILDIIKFMLMCVFFRKFVRKLVMKTWLGGVRMGFTKLLFDMMNNKNTPQH